MILPDNDESGRKHVEAVAPSLVAAGARVLVLELPGLDPKGDVINWRDAGGTAEQLLALAETNAKQCVSKPVSNGESEPFLIDDGYVPQGEPVSRKPKMEIEWFSEAADSALNAPVNPLIEDLFDEGACGRRKAHQTAHRGAQNELSCGAWNS